MEALEAAAAVRQELSCPLCLKQMRNPQTFNTPMCGHTFCKDCVVATLEGPGIVKSQCPVCKQPAWKRDLHTNHKYTAISEATAQLEAVLRMQGLVLGLLDASVEDAVHAVQAATNSPRKATPSPEPAADSCLHHETAARCDNGDAAGQSVVAATAAAETIQHSTELKLSANPRAGTEDGAAPMHGHTSQPDTPSAHQLLDASVGVSNAGDEHTLQCVAAAEILRPSKPQWTPAKLHALAADVQHVSSDVAVTAVVQQQPELGQQNMLAQSQGSEYASKHQSQQAVHDQQNQQQCADRISHLQQLPQQATVSESEQVPGQAYWQFQKLLADMINSTAASMHLEQQPLQLPDSFISHVCQLPRPGTADVLKLQQDLYDVEAMLEDLEAHLQTSLIDQEPGLLLQQQQDLGCNNLGSHIAAESTQAPSEAADKQLEQQLQHQQQPCNKLAQGCCMQEGTTLCQPLGLSRHKHARASGCSRGCRGISSGGAAMNMFAGLSGPSAALPDAARLGNCSGPLVGQSGRPSLERAFEDVMAAAAHAADRDAADEDAVDGVAAGAVAKGQQKVEPGQQQLKAAWCAAERASVSMQQRQQQQGPKSGQDARVAQGSKDSSKAGSGSHNGLKKARTARSTAAAAAAAAASEEYPLDAQCRRSSRKRTSVMKAPSQVDQAQVTAKAVIGLRIQLFWDGDGRYYSGTITKYNHRTKLHTIVYDDGEVETGIDLDKECWMPASHTDDPMAQDDAAASQQQQQQQQHTQQQKMHQQQQQQPSSSAVTACMARGAQQQQQPQQRQQQMDMHKLKKQLLQAKGFVNGRKQPQQPVAGTEKPKPCAVAVKSRRRQQQQHTNGNEVLSCSSSSFCGSDVTSGDDSAYDAEADDLGSEDDSDCQAAAAAGQNRHTGILLEQACSSDLEIAAANSDTPASDGFVKQQKCRRKRSRSRRQQATSGKVRKTHRQQRRCVSEPAAEAIWRGKQQQGCKRPLIPVLSIQRQQQQVDSDPDLENGSPVVPAAAAAVRRRTNPSSCHSEQHHQRPAGKSLVQQRLKDRHEQLLQQELEAAWANLSQQLDGEMLSSQNDSDSADCDDAADGNAEARVPVELELEQEQAGSIQQQYIDAESEKVVGRRCQPPQHAGVTVHDMHQHKPVQHSNCRRHESWCDGEGSGQQSHAEQGLKQRRVQQQQQQQRGRQLTMHAAATADGACVPVTTHTAEQHQSAGHQYCDLLSDTRSGSSFEQSSAFSEQQDENLQQSHQIVQKPAATAATGIKRMPLAAREQQQSLRAINKQHMLASSPTRSAAGLWNREDAAGVAAKASGDQGGAMGATNSVVVVGGMDSKTMRTVVAQLPALGAAVSKTVEKCTTCVVAPVDEAGLSPYGPNTVYKALLMNIPVVGDHWLYDSLEHDELLPVQDYLVQGFQSQHQRFLGGPARSLQSNGGSRRLFEGYAIIVAAVQPSQKDLEHQQGISALAKLGGACTILQGPGFTDVSIMDQQHRHQPTTMTAATELCVGQKVLLISCNSNALAALQLQWSSAELVVAKYILECILMYQMLDSAHYRMQA